MSSVNIDFADIVDRIKEYSGLDAEYKVGELLGFKQSTFASRKIENSVPYASIVSYAHRENVSTDWIFFGRGKPKEDGFDQTSPEEKEHINKVLKFYRNPATKVGIQSTIDIMVKVPAPDSDTE